MIGRDRRCDVLQQHRFASLWRRDDQTTLAFADRRAKIDGTSSQIFRRTITAFELQTLGRMQRRQVFEQHLITCVLRRIKVDLADLQQRKVSLTILGRTDQTRNAVTGAQIEATNLRRTDVNIIGTSEIRAICRTQEAEAILQNLEHAVAVDVLALASMGLQQTEDDVLLARARHVLDTKRSGHFHQLADGHRLQRRQVHRLA